MEDRQFEILHHSYRTRWASGQKFAEKLGFEEGEEVKDWQYYIHNLVFRATDEFKEICLLDTAQWRETRVCIDTERYEEYLDKLIYNLDEDMVEVGEYNGEPTYEWNPKNTSGIDRSSLFITGYTDNCSSFLTYNEKFDVFRFHEYLQYNPATTGILKFIDELKDGASYGITCDYDQFYSCLRSLEFFWD